MKLRAGLTLAVMVVVVLGLGPASSLAQSPVPIEINFVISLTGGAAFLGQGEQRAFQVAEAEINAHGGIRGRPVKFVYGDDASNPQTGVQLVSALVAKKASVFIGSPLAAVCQAFGPLVAQAGPVNYCLAPPIHAPAGGYVFVSGASGEDLGEAFLRNLRDRGLTRVAIITGTDATGRDMDASFATLFARPENKAFTVVAYEHFSPTDISVTAQLARIKTANPQALLTWTVGTPMGTVLRGVRDIGLDVPVVAANGNMLFTEMTQFANILPKEYLFPAYRAQTEGTTAPGPIRDAQTTFFRAMKAAGLRPDIASVLCWDAIAIVVDALKHVGPDASAQQIREYINGLHGFAGVNGLYDFRGGDQRGLSASAIVVDRWDAAKGTFVSVSKAGGAAR